MMNKKINISFPFFVILGGMCGAFMALPGAFFMDVMVKSYTFNYSFSYMDWICLLAPCFAFIGVLFNTCAGVFLYEEPKKKKFLFWEWS